MKSMRVYFAIMAAAVVTLSACKKESGVDNDPYNVAKMSYKTRAVDVNLTPQSDKIDIPVLVELDRGAAWGSKTHPYGVGAVLLDSTSAVEYLQFAFVEAAPTITEDGLNAVYNYQMKLYPSRITEPVTITLVSNEFRLETRKTRKAEVIDTLKINVYPIR